MWLTASAGPARSLAQAISLTHGWVPTVVQAIAVVILVLAIGWRSSRWRLLWVPVAVLIGVVSAALIYWYVTYQGLVGDPAPPTLWLWLALTGLAAGVLALGWRGDHWWRRGTSALAVLLCALSAALALNLWVGYLPTVHSAWDYLTGAALPGQTDPATVAQLQRQGGSPNGTIVTVTIPGDASGFNHRDELVYLPPAWYATTPPPRLPVVMMIGPEIGSPEDWLRSGDAGTTIDKFAAAHGGNAPVLVFVDSSGAFSNDTECVNGIRGNAADHLTNDVVPYMISHFGVSPDPANWGIAGWSSGGTCALTLTLMHPQLFNAFVDIDGQLGPNVGTKRQTIARLFGGDADAWAVFDPRTIIPKHGPYTGISALFYVSDDTPTMYRNGTTASGDPPVDQPDEDADSEQHAAVANYLCDLVSRYGIECSVVAQPGKHGFPSAATMFASAFPWLAGRIGTPGVPAIPLPGAPPP
jgi:S-formylglutathione hydrolase FrmB